MEEPSGAGYFFGRKGKIPHYYGDSVRAMFIASAIVYAVSLPLFGNLIPVDIATGTGIIIVLIFLAGITGPHNRWLMFINAVVAGVGVYLAEMAAITLFDTSELMLFIMRQLVAILLMFGFYYSVKSFRSMMSGSIGKNAKPGEFEKKN